MAKRATKTLPISEPLVIERKVVPHRLEHYRRTPTKRSLYPWLTLEVGKSFFVPCGKGDISVPYNARHPQAALQSDVMANRMRANLETSLAGVKAKHDELKDRKFLIVATEYKGLSGCKVWRTE